MDDSLGKYVLPKLITDDRETQTEQLQGRKLFKKLLKCCPYEKGQGSWYFKRESFPKLE